jgi:hypothetical protein
MTDKSIVEVIIAADPVVVEVVVPGSVAVVEVEVRGQQGIPGAVAHADEIRAIAADQDTVQIYDFEAIVAANLGV